MYESILKQLYIFTGCIDAGLGCTHHNKLAAVLNIPTMHQDLFKRYENVCGPFIEEVARESCN